MSNTHPELPWGNDFEGWLEARGEREVAQAFRDFADQTIAQASKPKADALSDEEVDRGLRAAIPGGSTAIDWFLPYANNKGLSNIRDVVRAIVAAIGPAAAR